MYERSAIVLENYFEKVLGLNKDNNLKNNYENYSRLIEEIKEYQRVITEEEKVIKKFDESASEIEGIQSKQNKIHEQNVKVEEERNELFNDLSENTSSLDQRLQKIEEILEKNNESLKELREQYVKTLIIFTERQKERNKYARMHRTEEANYLNILKQTNADFEKFDYKQMQMVKAYIDNYKEKNEELIEIMLRNGKNERVPFDEQVIRKAVEERSKIAREEAELYISVYERMKKLLAEVNNGTVKLAKSEKLLRDVSVKLAFLHTKKEYIVVFLDNERMTAMNGKKAHDRLMEDACENFELDIKQIDNLYELILKETAGRATKKAYKELYNKNYLRDIEENEKDFEEEAVNIKINMGTLINSNYWRIEGIKNVYNTFQDEVSEKFDKDLSEYRIDETDETLEENKSDKSNNTEEVNSSKEQEKNTSEISDYDNKENNNSENIDNDEDEENDGYQEVVFDEEEEAAENNYNFSNEDDDSIEPYKYSYDDDDDDDYYDDDYDDDEYDDEEYENEYGNEDEEDEEDDDIVFDDEDEITEEKIDQIIKDSRKGKKKKEERGLFGKLFKK